MKKLIAKARGLMARSYALELSLLLCAIVLLTQTGMLSQRRAEALRGGPEASEPEAVEYVALSSGIDPADVAERLVDSVIQVESGGNARMVGRVGERGIMQIKRATWKQVTRHLYGEPISFDRAFDPKVNRRVGRAYLAEIQAFLHKHRGKWKSDERSLLLACYNIGPTRVQKSGFDVRRLPRSVQSYVERASALHDYYLAEQAPLINMLLAEREREATGDRG